MLHSKSDISFGSTLFAWFQKKSPLSPFDWTQWDYNRVNRFWVCPLITMWTPPRRPIVFRPSIKITLSAVWNCSIVSIGVWELNESGVADFTMETAAVARGGRVLINESAATAFKNRIAAWPQIELLGTCDCMYSSPILKCTFKHLPAGKRENGTTGHQQGNPDEGARLLICLFYSSWVANGFYYTVKLECFNIINNYTVATCLHKRHFKVII